MDDEPNIRSGLAMALEEESYEVSTAQDATSAWAVCSAAAASTGDHRPEDAGPGVGLDLVREIKHGWPETLILVITAMVTSRFGR